MNNVHFIIFIIIIFIIGTRTYPIFGSVDDYGSNDQSNLVVSNLTCPVANSSTFSSVFGSCDNATSVSNNGGCSEFEEEPVISCIDSKCMYNEDTWISTLISTLAVLVYIM